MATNPAIINMQQYLKVINNLNNKIKELEKEIERLKNIKS